MRSASLACDIVVDKKKLDIFSCRSLGIKKLLEHGCTKRLFFFAAPCRFYGWNGMGKKKRDLAGLIDCAESEFSAGIRLCHLHHVCIKCKGNVNIVKC
jgi:hypothetical protein